MSEIPATFYQNTNRVSTESLSAKLHYGHVNVPHSTMNRFFTTCKIKSTVSLTDQTVKCKFDRVSNPTYSTPPDYESEDLEKPITHSTVYSVQL